MNKRIIESAQHCVYEGYCPTCQFREYGRFDGCLVEFTSAIDDHFEQYRWHDLRKDHTDLPEVEGHFNVCVWLKPNDAWGIEESYIYDTQYFCERFQTTGMSEVIAWKEIEPFESEE